MALTTYPSLTLTAGAANTKGSYTALIASTPAASSRLHLVFHNASAANKFFLIDVATGGVGVESVVVANLAVAGDVNVVFGVGVALDLDLPAGTRVAARCQSVTAAATCTLSVLLEDRALGSLTAPVTYGANTAASRGTQVDPGGVASTKGTYVEFSPSTPSRTDALVLCSTTASQAQSIVAYTAWSVDVSTGALGVETVAIADVRIDCDTSVDTARPVLIRLPIAIPAATRLAVRCNCNQIATPARLLCVTLIGLQEPAGSGGGGGSAGAVAYVG